VNSQSDSSCSRPTKPADPTRTQPTGPKVSSHQQPETEFGAPGINPKRPYEQQTAAKLQPVHPVLSLPRMPPRSAAVSDSASSIPPASHNHTPRAETCLISSDAPRSFADATVCVLVFARQDVAELAQSGFRQGCRSEQMPDRARAGEI
jgi:hypothetical protein